MNLPVVSVQAAVREIMNTCNLIIVDDKTVTNALGLHGKYGYSYYDSLMLASALEIGSKYLLTEDMADGQIIEDILTIRNIFLDEQLF
jgi:predicted nucleic acid-binding protein